MNKKELRKYALIKRKSLRCDYDLLEKELVSKLNGAKTVAIYYPLEYEISVLFLRKYNLNLCFPKTEGLNMDFYMNPTSFKEGSFHVMEPVDGTIVDKNDIDLMIVPALVINSKGYRIGYGKGFYDRYLNGTNIRTIGVCYSDLAQEFDEEENDIRLGDYICAKA